MLELDVGVTKDDKIVVSHDTTLDRTTSGTGTIESRTLKQIRRLDAAYWFAKGGDDAYAHDKGRKAYKFRGIATGKRKPPKGFKRRDFRVPTLREVMKAFPRTPINIEIKGRTPDEATEEYVRNAEVLAAALDAHAAARPDRRLLRPAGGRPLPRAGAARSTSRPASTARRRSCSGAARRVTASSPSSSRSRTRSATRCST